MNFGIEMNRPVYYPDSALINSKLSVGGYDLLELAERFGTPLYVIDEQTVRNTARKFKEALSEFYPNSMPIYASKALSVQAVLKVLEQEGFGLDVVSEGEIYTAESARFPMSKAFLHGNNKSPQEISYMADLGGKVIIDNFYELDILKKLDKSVEVLIRVTPGVECHTHEYIRTGQHDSKFGFGLEDLDSVIEQIQATSHLTLLGLHAHIGSQIFEIEPFVDCARILLEQYKRIKDKYNLELPYLNVGGGFGMHYTGSDDPPDVRDTIKAISDTIIAKCKEYGLLLPRLIIEPGRSIIARAGVTLYSVGAIKDIPNTRKYISVDGGMADNPRPITYQAEYEACLVRNPQPQSSTQIVTLAGRYCESGDILIKDLELPEDVLSGDIIAVFGTGAYNYSMSSHYNRVPKPAMVLVNNGEAEIILQRETLENLVQNDVLPSRFEEAIQGIISR